MILAFETVSILNSKLGEDKNIPHYHMTCWNYLQKTVIENNYIFIEYENDIYIYIYIISNFDSQFRKIKPLFFNGSEVLFYLGFLKGEKLSNLQG